MFDCKYSFYYRTYRGTLLLSPLLYEESFILRDSELWMRLIRFRIRLFIFNHRCSFRMMEEVTLWLIISIISLLFAVVNKITSRVQLSVIISVHNHSLPPEEVMTDNFCAHLSKEFDLVFACCWLFLYRVQVFRDAECRPVAIGCSSCSFFSWSSRSVAEVKRQSANSFWGGHTFSLHV